MANSVIDARHTIILKAVVEKGRYIKEIKNCRGTSDLTTSVSESESSHTSEYEESNYNRRGICEVKSFPYKKWLERIRIN